VFWLATVGFLFGLVLLIAGMRGRFVGDAPPSGADQCPKCGTSLPTPTGRQGKRRRNRGMLGIGGAVAAVALFVALIVGPPGVDQWRWQSAWPTSLLLQQAENARTDWALWALNELKHRAEYDALTLVDARKLSELCIAEWLRDVPRAPRKNWVEENLQYINDHYPIPVVQLKRLYQPPTKLRLGTRDELILGYPHELTVNLETDVPWNVFRYHTECGRLYYGSTRAFFGLGRVSAGLGPIERAVIVEHPKPTEAGTVDIRASFHLEVTTMNETYTFFDQMLTLTAERTVLAEEPDGYKPFTHSPASDGQAAKAVCVSRAWVGPFLSPAPEGEITINFRHRMDNLDDQLTAPLAGDCIVRVRGEWIALRGEHRLDTTMSQTSPEHLTIPEPAPETIDIAFRARREAAFGWDGIDRVWSGILLFRDIPVGGEPTEDIAHCNPEVIRLEDWQADVTEVEPATWYFAAD
jgi:hypothetical protein